VRGITTAQKVDLKIFRLHIVVSFKIKVNSLEQGLQTTARGPNPAREAISSGRKYWHFVNNEKIIFTGMRKMCWFDRMWHYPKQSHYVRCPALELLFTSLCGLLTKKFVDPWPREFNTFLLYCRSLLESRLLPLLVAGNLHRCFLESPYKLWQMPERVWTVGAATALASFVQGLPAYRIWPSF